MGFSFKPEGKEKEYYDIVFREKTPERIDVEFQVTNVTKFLEWCGAEVGQYELALECTKHQKREPEIEVHVPHAHASVIVKPWSKMVIVREEGLHYVCQHGIELLPLKRQREIHDVTFPREDFQLGYLYTLRGEKLPVTALAITEGLMLTEKQVVQVGEFADWIRLFSRERR